MARHELKTWPQVFAPLCDGSKRFEVRRNDRDFAVGDQLLLREYDPGSGYTGRACLSDVTYILHGPDFGVPDGMCVMSLGTPLIQPAGPRA